MLTKSYYGCYNRTIRHTVQYQDGWTEDGRRIMLETPFRMSTVCHWEFRTVDSKCAGCTVPGEEDEKVI